MHQLRALFHLLGMAVIISTRLIPVVTGVTVFKKDIRWAIRQRQGIAGALVRFLNIKVTQTGHPQDGNFLFISNHQSYIDPVPTAHAVAFLPVAKAEVAKWPLFGFAVKATGILFVVREDRDSRAGIRAAVRTALAGGMPVLIYPEGTTSTSSCMLPIRPATFQTAAELGIGVVPIAIRYDDPTDAWVGDDQFIPHFMRCFGKPEVRVRLHFGDPVFDRDSEILMKKVRGLIDGKLAEWAAGTGRDV